MFTAMIIRVIALLLVASTSALPTGEVASSHPKYQLAFTTDGSGPSACYHATRLYDNGTYGIVIVADPGIPLHTTQGSLITLNGTSPRANLVFHDASNFDTVIGGAGVPLPNVSPSSPAFASPVSVYKGYGGDSKWVVTPQNNSSSDVGIFHSLYAANEDLFACEGRIGTATVSVLSFGKYGGNLDTPAGCKRTEVKGFAV